jgi:patatin-like phospholipase/acyl hydrolase
MHNHVGIEKAAKRRILCIDGGGLIGTFPAAFLAALEERLEKPIGQYFDLIAGTSTGGIIALGLGMGLQASEILQLYEDKGAEIFGQNFGPIKNYALSQLRKIRWLRRAKHDSDKLREALVEVFGERRIGNALTRLVIPAWSSTTQSVYIYKTAHHPRLRTDYKALVVDAALATAAAPTYFKAHITEHDVGLVDGGVWANNPIGIAVVEAVTLLDWPGDSLYVLSLGCLNKAYSIPVSAGLLTLGNKAISLLMDGQSHGAMGIAKLLTGHEHERQAIYRVDHTVPFGEYGMDDAKVIGRLKGLGYERARDRYPVLEKVFFDQPTEEFNPYYSLGHEGAS